MHASHERRTLSITYRVCMMPQRQHASAHAATAASHVHTLTKTRGHQQHHTSLQTKRTTTASHVHTLIKTSGQQQHHKLSNTRGQQQHHTSQHHTALKTKRTPRTSHAVPDKREQEVTAAAAHVGKDKRTQHLLRASERTERKAPQPRTRLPSHAFANQIQVIPVARKPPLPPSPRTPAPPAQSPQQAARIPKDAPRPCKAQQQRHERHWPAHGVIMITNSAGRRSIIGIRNVGICRCRAALEHHYHAFLYVPQARTVRPVMTAP